MTRYGAKAQRIIEDTLDRYDEEIAVKMSHHQVISETNQTEVLAVGTVPVQFKSKKVLKPAR